jgi:putative adhesin
MNVSARALVKRRMRKFFFVFAICALAASSTGIAAQRWSTETEHVSRTVPLEPGGTLRLNSFSGRVTITTTDRPEVVIDAVRRAPRERLSRIALDIHSDGSDTVVVDANRRERSWFMFSGSTVVDTDFDIKVPTRTNIDVNVFSASVSVDGVEGSQKLNGFSSRLTLNDVAGSVRAHTFSGSILVRAKTWEHSQSIDLDTFSGNIEVHVPDNAKGRVSFSSFSGHLNSEMPLTLHSGGGRRSLTADLGGGGDGSLRFKTFSGNVRIDR